MNRVIDYPKLYCPFVKDENHKIIDQLEPGFEWIYDKGVCVVDHCHEEGKVRGLLCHTCNIKIKIVEGDLEILKKSLKYVGKYESFQKC